MIYSWGKLFKKISNSKYNGFKKKRKVHVTDAWIKIKKKHQNFPIIDMKNVLLEFFLIKTIQSNQSNCVFPNVIMHCWFKKKKNVLYILPIINSESTTE